MNLVLTREVGHNDEARSWFAGDVMVREVPLTTTWYVPADVLEREVRASGHYGGFATLVVTSARTAHFVDVLVAAMAEGAEIMAVGAYTNEALARRGVHVDAQGESGAGSLAPLVSRGPVLLAGASSMREELPLALAERGLEVTRVTCYETRLASLTEEEGTVLREADVVLIGAPSAWAVARDLVRDDAWIVAVGETTAAAVRQSHQRVLVGWGPELRDRLRAL